MRHRAQKGIFAVDELALDSQLGRHDAEDDDVDAFVRFDVAVDDEGDGDELAVLAACVYLSELTISNLLVVLSLYGFVSMML